MHGNFESSSTQSTIVKVNFQNGLSSVRQESYPDDLGIRVE